VLRSAYLLELRGSTLFATPIGDARSYLEWARSIAAGDWLGREVFYQAPLYPYFLAVVLALGGSAEWGVRLVQVALGSLACVFLGRAAARSFGPAVGLIAGCGLALYAPAVYFDGLWQKPVLDGFLLSALLWLLAATPIGVGRAIGAGALLGALALSRENALALTPVVGLWLALLPGESRARRVRTVAGFALGLALVLAPVGARNLWLGGRFLVTTSQLGPNLWIGNHPNATGRYEPLVPAHGSARFERDDARKLAEAAAGRSLSPGEVSDYWRDRALAFARDEPLAWAKLQLRKVALVFSARELPDTEGIEAYTRESLLLRALFAVFHFGVLLPFAVVGALALRGDWRRHWLWPAAVLALGASVALFYVFARYRYALALPLLPLAALGGETLWRGALDPARRWLAARLAAVGIAAAIPVNWPGGGEDGVVMTHYSIGAALLDAGQLHEAEAELELAVQSQPSFAPAQQRLGDARRKLGDMSGALASYELALALQPGLAGAHAGRGIALDALGRGDEAEREYRRALELDPDHPDANNNLANRLLQEDRVAEALAHYQRALAARPDDADFNANTGIALFHAGDPQGALSALDHALALAPDHGAARFNRAVVLDQLGRRDEAKRELETLLAREPGDSAYARAGRALLARLTAP
jgi:tetratricopeptide (TPR) repeat protein